MAKQVQELFETEKSQTEVLHMECKRTGEFAHSESTHYESGEAFNGEVGQHTSCLSYVKFDVCVLQLYAAVLNVFFISCL